MAVITLSNWIEIFTVLYAESIHRKIKEVDLCMVLVGESNDWILRITWNKDSHLHPESFGWSVEYLMERIHLGHESIFQINHHLLTAQVMWILMKHLLKRKAYILVWCLNALHSKLPEHILFCGTVLQWVSEVFIPLWISQTTPWYRTAMGCGAELNKSMAMEALEGPIINKINQ